MAELAIEELSALSECAVCLSSTAKPKVLPCQHVFCLACLQGVYDQAIKRNPTKSGTLTCPVCSAVWPILGGDLTQLPDDFRGNQVTSIMENLRKATSASQCFSCAKNKHWSNAQVLCFDCAKVFCTDCHKKHITNKRFNDHVCTILSADGMNELRCTEHTEFFHTFCLDCAKGICQVCMVTSHVDHTVESFAPSYGKTSSPKFDTEQAKTNLKELQSRSNAIVDEQTHHVQTIKDDIRKHKIALIKKLDDEERELFAKLDGEFKDFKIVVDDIAHDIHSNLTNLEELENQSQIIQRPLAGAPDIKLAVNDFPSREETEEIMKATHELTLPSAPKYIYTEGQDGIGTLDDINTISKPNHSLGEGSNKTSKQDVAVVKIRYTAKQPHELTLRVGGRVRILARRDDQWWMGELLSGAEGKRVGSFPAYCVAMSDGHVDESSEMSHTQTKDGEIAEALDVQPDTHLPPIPYNLVTTEKLTRMADAHIASLREKMLNRKDLDVDILEMSLKKMRISIMKGLLRDQLAHTVQIRDEGRMSEKDPKQ